MNLELHKRLTREMDLHFKRKANATRFKSFRKRWIKKEKDKEIDRQSKLSITEIFELDRKGELV